MKRYGWTIAFALAGFVLGCGNSVKSVCEDDCQRQLDCDLGVDSEADLKVCKAGCEQRQAEAERDVETGRVTQECVDAQVDRLSCLLGLECSEIRQGDFDKCSEEEDKARDACN